MLRENHKICLLVFISALLLYSCGDFLDAKPEKSLVVPNSTKDLQALLENLNIFNSTPALDIVAADEYFNTQEGWVSYGDNMLQQVHLRNLEQMFEGVITASEWYRPYQQIYYANTCLQKATEIVPVDNVEQMALDNVVGSAKFTRAFAFFNLIKVFGVQYDPVSSGSKQGIPLPMKPDVTQIRPFSSLEEVYVQILKDLHESISLLPDLPVHKTRPSKVASHALLARVYLSMGDYESAEEHSSLGLEINNRLLDFSLLNPKARFPIPMANEEVVYHSVALSYAGFGQSPETRIDTLLVSSYNENDLRKSLYYVSAANGAINFRGNFSGGASLFTGLTVGEMFLIRSECLARRGEIQKALEDLNVLMETRWRKGEYEPISLVGKDDVLDKILEERKKELVFRGQRWTDLKRFAKEGREPEKLMRLLGGQQFIFETLEENFVFPVPQEEIRNR